MANIVMTHKVMACIVVAYEVIVYVGICPYRYDLYNYEIFGDGICRYGQYSSDLYSCG